MLLTEIIEDLHKEADSNLKLIIDRNLFGKINESTVASKLKITNRTINTKQEAFYRSILNRLNKNELIKDINNFKIFFKNYKNIIPPYKLIANLPTFHGIQREEHFYNFIFEFTKFLTTELKEEFTINFDLDFNKRFVDPQQDVIFYPTFNNKLQTFNLAMSSIQEQTRNYVQNYDGNIYDIIPSIESGLIEMERYDLVGLSKNILERVATVELKDLMIGELYKEYSSIHGNTIRADYRVSGKGRFLDDKYYLAKELDFMFIKIIDSSPDKINKLELKEVLSFG